MGVPVISIACAAPPSCLPPSRGKESAGARKTMTVGAATPRIDGIEKVTGAAKFTGDLRFADLLEAKVLRSPLAHAKIISIDTAKAASVPGVVAILTRDDLQDIDPYYGNCLRDRAVVATDKVRFVGEPVAVVAAESGQIAEAALALIQVDYQELPCVSVSTRPGPKARRFYTRPIRRRRISRCRRSGRILRRQYVPSRTLHQRHSRSEICGRRSCHR